VQNIAICGSRVPYSLAMECDIVAVCTPALPHLDAEVGKGVLRRHTWRVRRNLAVGHCRCVLYQLGRYRGNRSLQSLQIVTP
jgi:hypothetical protein